MRVKRDLWKYLNSYVKSYKENNGCSEHPHYLPMLVIYFRYAFDKLGINDVEVTKFLGWDGETAEDFLTWGHNSRYAHTFNIMLYDHLEEYVDWLKNAMLASDIQDFPVEIPEQEG